MKTELVEYTFQNGAKKTFTLYDLDEYKGFDSKELQEKLPSGTLERWNKWSMGNTCGLTPEGKVIVYQWDFDNFLSGRKNWD